MDECPICLDVLIEDIVTMSCCRQKIHHLCAVQWMSHHMSCPMCRYNYVSVVTSPELVIQDRKPHFFRNMFLSTFCLAMIAPCSLVYHYFLT